MTEPPQLTPLTSPPSGLSKLTTTARAVLVVVAVIVLGLGAIAYGAWGQGSGPSLAEANAACNDGRTDVQIGDDGSTMVIDARGTEAILGTIDVETEACILQQLGAPAAAVAHIEGTRALDGRQTDTWDGYSASWIYHPDEGLDIVIEQR